MILFLAFEENKKECPLNNLARLYDVTVAYRPREMSSKKPVSRFREVIHVPKADFTTRDPRFNEKAGHLNLDLFKKTYSFVDDIKKKEREVIVKEAKKTRDLEKKSQLQRLLQKMVSICIVQFNTTAGCRLHSLSNLHFGKY